MGGYRILSSDSHIVEPPDLWQERIDPKFRDRAPRLVLEGDHHQWYVDGDHKFSSISLGQAGQRFVDASKIVSKGLFEEVTPRGGYDPHAHVEDMNMDSVAAGVLYASTGLLAFCVPDSELLSAICRASNDFMIDFCKPYPDRLKGIGLINLDDVADGVGELKRIAEKGLAGAMIATPPLEHRYDDPIYEPLWATAQELSMPLSLHSGGIRSKEWPTDEPTGSDRVSFVSTRLNNAVTCLAAMTFSGVFERYPRLKVVAAEFEVCWVPWFIMRMDDIYKYRSIGYIGHRFDDDEALPSDFIRRNVYYSFQEDPFTLETRHIIGVDNLMWGSDYPHPEGTFPKSQEIVERVFQGIPEDEKAKILGTNCAEVYGFKI